MLDKKNRPIVVVQTFNPTTHNAEAGGVQLHSGLHRMFQAKTYYKARPCLNK